MAGTLSGVAAGGRSSASRERLAFNLGGRTVPTTAFAEALIASERQPTFATVAKAEPRDWGYFGLLAFTAVLLVRPQDQIPALTPLHLAELCAIVGTAPMMLHRLARRQPVFRVTAETIGLVVFGLVILATAPFSIWPGGAVGVFTESYVKVLVVFVLMMNTLTTPKRLDQIVWLILLCCGYIAALSIVSYFRGVNLVEGDRLDGPIRGMFGNPNDLAMNMVTFLPMAVVVAMMRHASNLKRLTAATIVVLQLATIVFTKSRGGMIGLVAMLIVLVLLGRHVRRGFASVTIIGVLVVSPLMPASFWNRMTTILDDRKDAQEYTGSREARRQLIEQGVQVFVDFPLTGVGAGQFRNYNPSGREQQWRETHNTLLQVAAETGIVGLLAFSFLIASGAIAARSAARMLKPPRSPDRADPLRVLMSEEDRSILRSHTVGLTAALAGWFVCALFASVAYNWTFYYVLALIVAIRELTRDRMIAAQALTQKAKSFSARSTGTASWSAKSSAR